MSMLADRAEYVIGVDTHRDSHTVAVCTPAGAVIWETTVAADVRGYERLWRFALERATGRRVFLEVLGFWRRSSAEKHLARLRQHAPEPFLLAVSDQLHIDEADLEGLPAGIHRFRQMPLPDEIARLAGELTTG